tara:strand:- start:583 stop:888 length:306 start_codon:yes stop_codon:yes gene_type:complete
VSEEKVPVHTGKLWKKESYHETFESADAIRNKLLRIWKDDDKHKGMQVKVRFLPSRNQFVVKTRLHPDFEPVKKEKKKNVKRSKKNKRDNVDGKFDPQRSD